MLIPRKVKHRKQHHPRQRGIASGGTSVSFGEYGIQALEHAYITNRQIESARIAINRHIKRGGKVWINIFPDRPLTKKPAETRMGSGKGSPEWWVANVKPGRVLFELSYPDEKTAREALTRAIHKLPIKARIDRQLVDCTGQCFPRGLLIGVTELEQHAAGLYVGNPPLRRALTRTHAGFGRLLGQRTVREDVDPHLAATLDVPVDGDTSGLDLPVGDVGMLQRLDAIVTEAHRRTAAGDATLARMVLLAVL